MTRMRGTIGRLIRDKGFGFVVGDWRREYFFHRSACVDPPFDQLQEGQLVTFDAGEGPKGPRAENVRAQ